MHFFEAVLTVFKNTLNNACVKSYLTATFTILVGKTRKGAALDAGNFRGFRCVAKSKMLKMCIFEKDGDVNNSNFVKAIHRSNDILYTIKEMG